MRKATREAMADQEDFIAELGRLKGWEPTWQEMATGLSAVRMDERLQQTWSDGTVSEQSTSWWKDGDQELGMTVYRGSGRSDWRFDGGVYSQRWEQGPWKVFSTQRNRTRSYSPPGWEVLQAWQVSPGTVRHEPGGRLVYRLPQWMRDGWIELEAQQGSRIVEAIRMYGPEGRLRWHESRTFDLSASRPLLKWRERRYFEPVGTVQVEDCTWTFGPAASLSAALAAVNAR